MLMLSQTCIRIMTADCGTGMREVKQCMYATELKVGDTIKFQDAEDMINTMFNLNHCGIETDFMYEKDGERGLWLEVIEVS